MRHTLIAALACVALVPAIARAQPLHLQEVYTPVVPGCRTFTPEYPVVKQHDIPRANGGEIICFQLPMSPATQTAWEEMAAREKAQIERMDREYKECGYQSQDIACLQRVARETPFPVPSPKTGAYFAHKRLSWGE